MADKEAHARRSSQESPVQSAIERWHRQPSPRRGGGWRTPHLVSRV